MGPEAPLLSGSAANPFAAFLMGGRSPPYPATLVKPDACIGDLLTIPFLPPLIEN
jgi:hypothetical protein